MGAGQVRLQGEGSPQRFLRLLPAALQVATVAEVAVQLGVVGLPGQRGAAEIAEGLEIAFSVVQHGRKRDANG